MNWISVHDRLPSDGQRVLVWYGCGWQEAEFYKGIFYAPARERLGTSAQVPDVERWAEVKIPESAV